MGDVVGIGKVVFDGDDPRAPGRAAPGPKLVTMPKREKTEIEQAAEPFVQNLTAVDNFVIFMHKKDGSLDIVQCLDGDLPTWEFVDAFKRHTEETITKRLTGPKGPNPQGIA